MAVEPCGGYVSASSPVKLDKSPGVRVVGKRIYDSANGKTCHQVWREGRGSSYFSGVELPQVQRHLQLQKRKGHQPTGILINTAKANGFSSVSEMLLKGAEHLNHERVGAGMVVPLKKEVVFSPRKRGKENSFDGKLDSNLPESVDKNSKKNTSVLNGLVDDNTSSKRINQGPDKRETKQEEHEDAHDCIKNNGFLSNETGSYGCEKKPKKMKRDRLGELSNGKNVKENLRKTSVDGNEKKPKKSRRDGLEEIDDSNEKDLTIAGSTSPTKLEVYNEMSNQGTKEFNGVDFEENVNCTVTVTKKNLVGTVENDEQKEEGGNTAKVKNFLKHQGADFHADIRLPVGTELTSVAGIDVCAEDIGNALQFLEFCSVFGKAIDLLWYLSRGAMLSPSYGKSSWFHKLKKCLSESQRFLKAQGVDSLEQAADYETLNASEKLRILNLLCDEVLGTKKVRNWIDDQNTKLAHKIKEAKQKFLAAKDKEKSLKQKMKDDIAKAIIAKDGATLSISEQEAVVSRLKPKVAQAHEKVLESKDLLLKSNQTSDAVRVERIYVGHGGHAYWKLNCCGKSDVLHQDVGKGDTLTLDEKWFALDVEGKEAIEKHINSLR
ncbi:hypothetical protein DH2020_015880 [Rehmannia glutinosa]|uniref:Uncharacterized protein n=1 Tax=Rehmannia glutinosa TaxID=99300 RepID=A0ABR0WVJ1_REHGL